MRSSSSAIRRRRLASTALGASAALLLAACSSSHTSASGSTTPSSSAAGSPGAGTPASASATASTPPSGSASSTGTGAAGGSDIVSQAKAAVAASTGTITKWNGPNTGPAAQKGKKIVIVSCDQNNQVCKAWAQAATNAAKVLGWTSSVINGQGTPTGWKDAITQAIALKPDGIILAGVDAQAEHAVVSQGAAQGIKFVGMHAAAAAGPDPSLDIFMNIQQNATDIAKLQTDYVIAQSNGQGRVVLYYDSQYAIAVAKDKAYLAELNKCSGCKMLKNVNFPISQLAQQTPTLVSGWISSFQKPFYVIAVGDSIFDYMPAALKADGVSTKDVMLVGADGTPPAYQRIRQGQYQVATVPEPADFEGWMAIDELNRSFAGSPPAVFDVPLYIVTPQDVSQEGGDQNVFNPSNGYQQHYKSIWGVQ